MLQMRTQWLPDGVPEPGSPVRACRQDGLAVRTKGRRENRAFVLQDRADGLAGGDIPWPGGVVFAPRDDGLAVRTESHGEDGAFMQRRHDGALAGRNLPKDGEAGLIG